MVGISLAWPDCYFGAAYLLLAVAISARFSTATEIFSWKKFRRAPKNRENRKIFLPRNFHGIRYALALFNIKTDLATVH